MGESVHVKRTRTDCESLRRSAWSIAWTFAASPVSLTIKYGFVSVWSASKMDVSCVDL